jgi:hypothetical protein
VEQSLHEERARFLPNICFTDVLNGLLVESTGENRIDVYVALFALEFFIGSELTSPFSPALHRRKTLIEVMFLAIFAAIVVKRVVEILQYSIT